MKAKDKLIIGVFFGVAFPVLYFLLSILVWFYFDRNEDRVMPYILVGLILAFITDFRYLKDWISKWYELPVWFVTGMYIFYNFTFFGFFMGFPVFNVLLGIIAGYYYGKRITTTDIPEEYYPGIIHKVSIFTGLFMTLICIASGFIGLSGRGVGSEIQSMLGLKFEVTRSMLWEITLIGGIILVLVEVLLTRIVMQKTIENNKH